MPRKMPDQKPGNSVQNVGTPRDFLDAARIKLGITDFSIDLAADDLNHVTETYWTEAENSLIQSWAPWCASRKWAWLNPPFSDIAPWAEKCYEESRKGAFVAFLVPASVGANWWRDWVHEKAPVLFLNGRLTFVGHHQPYPKDLALVLYQPSPVVEIRGHYEIWNWRETLRRVAA